MREKSTVHEGQLQIKLQNMYPCSRSRWVTFIRENYSVSIGGVKKKKSEAWVGSRDKRPDPNFPRFRSAANITLFAISLRFTKLVPGVGYSCNF